MYEYYRYYRQINSIGRLRAWQASKTDRRYWDEVAYPAPPEMRYPGITVILGSRDCVAVSYIRIDRCSRIRGTTIESAKKLKRLRKRRLARQYRMYQKRTGIF